MAYKTLPQADPNNHILYANAITDTYCLEPAQWLLAASENALRTLVYANDGFVYRCQLIADPADPGEDIKSWVKIGSWNPSVRGATFNGGEVVYPDSAGILNLSALIPAITSLHRERQEFAGETMGTVLGLPVTNALPYPIRLLGFQVNTQATPTTHNQTFQLRNSGGTPFTDYVIVVPASGAGDYQITYNINIAGAKIADPNVTYEVFQYKKVGAGAYDGGTNIGEIAPAAGGLLVYDVTSDPTDDIFYKFKHRVKASVSKLASNQTASFSNEVKTDEDDSPTLPYNFTLYVPEASIQTIQPGGQYQRFWVSTTSDGGITNIEMTVIEQGVNI